MNIQRNCKFTRLNIITTDGNSLEQSRAPRQSRTAEEATYPRIQIHGRMSSNKQQFFVVFLYLIMFIAFVTIITMLFNIETFIQHVFKSRMHLLVLIRNIRLQMMMFKCLINTICAAFNILLLSYPVNSIDALVLNNAVILIEIHR